ncbi:hypothetical protein WEN_01975 [Mycoplasma wenyonii str. Massachusetts]|uniref:Uncharacterized protein n=2 Tax=Mycoplasma wenyonii TaxID=65123 RepID=I6YB37_MYCWM|nr:hypothetical protein WEN_01975 [Mycoplasma wenyonii str. Massachusetts]
MESDEESNSLASNWSPSVFPFQENRDLTSSKDIVTQHSEYVEKLLSPIKEIGYYYPEDQSLTLDRSQFCHYLLSGCKVSKALQRLLQNIEFDLAGMEKFQLSTLLSGGKGQVFEVKNTSKILEFSERSKKKK